MIDGIPRNLLEKSIGASTFRRSFRGYGPGATSGDATLRNEALGPHGADVVEQIAANGRIVFHSAGDSGASNAGKYSDEIRVFDQVAADVHTASPEDRPAFFYHLGDLVYNFGESKYYFDQFYEPNRAYPGPILSLAGNHDSFLIPDTDPAEAPLAIFARNFCSTHPVVTPEAGSLHRTAMTQPGVYFALDAPFVRIIGLFSNALEDPGVISGEGGKWDVVPDFQLEYLDARRCRRSSTRSTRGPSCWPSTTRRSRTRRRRNRGRPGATTPAAPTCSARSTLSARRRGSTRTPSSRPTPTTTSPYTRTVHLGGHDLDVPFVVCGSGGHNVNPLARAARGGSRR